MGIPATLMPIFESLSPDVQIRVSRDYERRRKSKVFAYIAWLTLGWHYLYLRRLGLQFAFFVSIIIGIGLFWWFVELFLVARFVDEINEDLARKLMVECKDLGV